jgi:copper chaperone
MKMKTNEKNLKFKTNINCTGCVAKVAPFLNDAEGICHWDVDTETQDKILSVHSDGITEEEVMRTIEEAGFRIELLNK